MNKLFNTKIYFYKSIFITIYGTFNFPIETFFYKMCIFNHKNHIFIQAMRNMKKR